MTVNTGRAVLPMTHGPRKTRLLQGLQIRESRRAMNIPTILPTGRARKRNKDHKYSPYCTDFFITLFKEIRT